MNEIEIIHDVQEVFLKADLSIERKRLHNILLAQLKEALVNKGYRTWREARIQIYQAQQ